jgi:hypothetical protein
MKRTIGQAALLIILGATPLVAQTPERPLGTLREQSKLQHHWLTVRLDSVLPMLMRKYDVELWVVAMREYNEDPVFRGLVAPETFAARRRTIYMFHDRAAAGFDKIALGGSSQGGLYEAVRGSKTLPDGRRQELWGKDQWDLFAEMVRERDPRTIGVNISEEHNFADGLSAGEWSQMEEALGPELASRVVRAEGLAIDYLYLRVPEMVPTFKKMQGLAWEIISTAFSDEVIVPGVTTTEDVVWWMRQQLADKGLATWFHTSVDVQRFGGVDGPNPVIQRGDVLHCDFGITALGLNTDTQHMGYVLREGETDAPEGLKQALAAANRLQDIALEAMVPGRSGNEALLATLSKMREEGIDGTVYSHPVGDHGHASGPLIGLWDRQEGVPGRGDVRLLPSTWYAIELQATSAIPEWDGQRVRMAQEEDAEMTPDGTMQWLHKRQDRLHIVR